MRPSDFISVAPRYARSINLERDGFTSAAVDGYVVTSTANDFLLRFARSLSGGEGHRAWTITGPYGAGKSSFALFFANLLSPAEVGGASAARRLLKQQHPDSHRSLFDGRSNGSLGKDGFTAVVVSGAAEPLIGAILRCTLRDVSVYYASQGRKPEVFKELEDLVRRSFQGEELSTTSVVSTILRLSQNLVSSKRSRGILLVIDELGKFLEFAARTQTAGELFVLQQIAEATGEGTSCGLYLVTILHQSFERYAAELRPTVREEWAKIQGRFEDIAFQEPPEQMIELVSRAIITKNPGALPARILHAKAIELAEQAGRLNLAPHGMSPKAFAQALSRCALLHPLTVVVLVRLCRKFGQNQRSLFSFLTSREAHGFLTFLQKPVETFCFFGLPELYDYLTEGFGSGLAVGEAGVRWAEIQTTLERSKSLSDIEVQFIKTVGILSAIGAVGELRPSPDVIRFALGLSSSDFKRCKLGLSDRSLIVERKHSGTIALWEGSDLDLEEEVRNAGRHIASNASLAEKLNELWAPRPLVAKRHSFRTGTLRYFAVRFADAANLSKSLDLDHSADGLLLYCLPLDPVQRKAIIGLASDSNLQEKPGILVAVPEEVNALQDAVRELEALRFVQANTRELEADAVARRELRARISVAESRVAREVQLLFSPEEQTARKTQWFHHGMLQLVPTTRSLANDLSSICDTVYPKTPILRNELVNRRHLSSAGAAARRNLMNAMLSRHSEVMLGFSGTPPEVSIYSSILASTGLHRQESGIQVFGPPQHDGALLSVWQEITSFFSECELIRHTVSDLFEVLQRPPFGLKMGVIPILFCAAAIAHDTEIAFYENGAYVPELTAEAFERLVKYPGTFELRKYRIEGLRREVYTQLAGLFGHNVPPKGESLLSVVKPLFRFLRKLPQYCQKTSRLSPRTVAVRSALLHAKEPDQLLFEQLPKACGLEAFEADDLDPKRSVEFFAALRTSITELQRAYDDLLKDVQLLLFQAFDLQQRSRLQDRAISILRYCVEPRLKAAVNHMANEHMDDSLWIEAIATTLAGKAPKSWEDEDRVRFEIALSQVSRNMRHLEALVYEEKRRVEAGGRPEEVYRLGVANRHSMEVGAVVVVEANEQRAFTEAVMLLEGQLATLNFPRQIILAALASVSQHLLAEYNGTETEKKLAEANHA